MILIACESADAEPRVAGSPQTVKKMKALGLDVIVAAGASELSKIPDNNFEKVGARIGTPSDAVSADVVLEVRRPTAQRSRATDPALSSSPRWIPMAMKSLPPNWRVPASELLPWS
jgi:NAD/NADP transhydrogenase alpha subunit